MMTIISSSKEEDLMGRICKMQDVDVDYIIHVVNSILLI